MSHNKSSFTASVDDWQRVAATPPLVNTEAKQTIYDAILIPGTLEQNPIRTITFPNEQALVVADGINFLVDLGIKLSVMEYRS